MTAVLLLVLLQAPLPLCSAVTSGECVKLPPTTWDKAARVTFGASLFGEFLDTVSTTEGIARGVLRERNPFLARWERDLSKMMAAKAAIAVGVHYILLRLLPDHPRWVALFSSVNAGVKVWVAGHNRREAGR